MSSCFFFKTYSPVSLVLWVRWCECSKDIELFFLFRFQRNFFFLAFERPLFLRGQPKRAFAAKEEVGRFFF